MFAQKERVNLHVDPVSNWHLAGLLDEAALKFGNHIYLKGAETLSFSETQTRSLQLASWFRAQGINKGTRVLILAPNQIEVVLSIFALARLGAIFSIVDLSIKPQALTAILEQYEPHFACVNNLSEEQSQCFVNTEGLELIYIDAEKESKNKGPCFHEAYSHEGTFFPFQGIDKDIACLIFTSGSTGRPRGVTLTHDNIRFAAQAIQDRLDYGPKDIVGLFLPLAFDYGFYQLFLAALGGSAVYLGSPEQIRPGILSIFDKEEISILSGVPTLFALVLKLLDRRKTQLPKLRKITNTGERFPPTMITQFKKHYPDLLIYLMYGLTECKRVSIMLPTEMEARGTSVGRPLPGTEVYILDEEGNQLGPGVPGEIVIKGRHVSLGYWKAEEETKQRFRLSKPGNEVLLYSGDQGYLDEEGFLYFKGRIDVQIKNRGYRLHPLEIEECVCKLADVQEAALIKVNKGNLVLFLVRKNKALGTAEIQNYLHQHLESYKIPDDLVFMEKLPTTGNRKVDRKFLANYSK